MPKMHQHTFGVLGRREGTEREGEGNLPPKVRVSRVNTGEEGKLCNEPMSHREEWRPMFFGSCDSFGLIKRSAFYFIIFYFMLHVRTA